MKINDCLQLKGAPVKIPECSRNDLPEFFVDRGYRVGAEIGVYKGAFTEKFCKAGLKMYAIDPWKGYSGAGKNQEIQERQDFLYGHTQRTLVPYRDCNIIRAFSMDAVKQFRHDSLDFVYIDGDHSFRYIAEDIAEWSKRVRSGGIVSGHDYCCHEAGSELVCHVVPVVKAYVEALGILDFYVFGKMENPKDKDDQYPSWMFIQP